MNLFMFTTLSIILAAGFSMVLIALAITRDRIIAAIKSSKESGDAK